MKKFLPICLTIILCLFCLGSCNSAHNENTWFSEEALKECLVDNLPTVTKNYVNQNNEDIYVSFTNKERESYTKEVYEYLKSRGFEYFGTRGDQVGTLAGMLTTYYFKPASELSEFYVDGAYKFVYSDGTADDSDDPIFSIISIYEYESKILEYGTKSFAYNTLITLRYKSDAPLSGNYILQDEIHEHTYQNHQDEIGHSWSYTCGCQTPPNFAQHFDGNYDGKCDNCSYEYELIFKLTADELGYKVDRVGTSYKGGDIVIPAEHKGLPIVEIGYGAFKSEKKLSSVVIPDSVTVISDDAFENQTSLTSVNVGKNVVTIGVSAFEGCTMLKTVFISDATEYIYASAFKGCSSLEAVTLGKNVKEITGSVFEECTSLKTITIPASIKKMGSWVFSGNNMTDIYFGVSAAGENWSEKWAEGLNKDVIIHWNSNGTTGNIVDDGMVRTVLNGGGAPSLPYYVSTEIVKHCLISNGVVNANVYLGHAGWFNDLVYFSDLDRPLTKDELKECSFSLVAEYNGKNRVVLADNLDYAAESYKVKVLDLWDGDDYMGTVVTYSQYKQVDLDIYYMKDVPYGYVNIELRIQTPEGKEAWVMRDTLYYSVTDTEIVFGLVSDPITNEGDVGIITNGWTYNDSPNN